MTETHTEQIEVIAYYMRGEPGHFTELVRSEALAPPAETRELRERYFDNGIGGYALPGRVLPANRWWEYYLHSAVHSACVDAKARDVVGGGYSMTLGEDEESPVLDAAAALIERSLDALQDACRDWETTGWCALECLPTRGGELYALNHLDSWTVWPVKDNGGYIHTRDGAYIWYSNLGERVGGAYQLAYLNNNHWYKSTYYGVPDVMSVITQIETAYEALKHNQEFFARRGGYRWLLLLSTPLGTPDTGGTPKLVQTINEYVKKLGKESTSDMLIIPIGNATATLQRLDADFKDLDFPTLLDKFRNDILMRHGVPPLRAGIVETGALGGNVGQEQLRSYNDNVVRPKQRRWNAFITSILQTWFDPRIEFSFDPLEISELAQLAQPVTAMFDALLVSRNEARAIVGLPPAEMDDGADVFADELQPEPQPNPFAPPMQGQPPQPPQPPPEPAA